MITPYTRFSPIAPACARSDGTVRFSESDVAMLLVSSRTLPVFVSAETIAESHCKRDRLTISAGTLWVFAQRLAARRASQATGPHLCIVATNE